MKIPCLSLRRTPLPLLLLLCALLALATVGCSDDSPGTDATIDAGSDGTPVDGGGDGDMWMGNDGAGPPPDPNMLPGCASACGADQVCKGGSCVDAAPAVACGSDKWGGSLPSSKVLYVDASYSAGDSDGTSGKPYQSIADALAKLPGDGYTLAITDGTYGQGGPLLITRSVTLRCRCAQNVRIGSPVVVTRTASSPAAAIQVQIARCRIAPSDAAPTAAPSCSGAGNDEPRGVTVTQTQTSQPVQLTLRDDTRVEGWCTGAAIIGSHSEDALCLAGAQVAYNVRGVDATKAAALLPSSLAACTTTSGVSIEDSRVHHNTDYGVFTRLGATSLSCKFSLVDENGKLSQSNLTGLGYGIYHGGVTRAEILSCRVRGNENRGAAFINAQGSAVSGSIAINKSVFDGNRGAGVALQALSLSGGVAFDQSRASGTRKLAGSVDAEGIQSSVDSGAPYRIDITRSRIDGNGRSGVLMNGVSGSVKDNAIARNATYGCLLQKTGNNVAVSGNAYAQNPSGDVLREEGNPLQKIATLPIPLP